MTSVGVAPRRSSLLPIALTVTSNELVQDAGCFPRPVRWRIRSTRGYFLFSGVRVQTVADSLDESRTGSYSTGELSQPAASSASVAARDRIAPSPRTILVSTRKTGSHRRPRAGNQSLHL